MQANSQYSGQLQNFHGNGTTPGNRTSQNFYQQCLPPHTASPSYSGQTATGNYFTCTIQPAISDQILASGVQATKGTKFAQENQPNSNHTLPTGKQDSQIILWNMPSSCQIYLPVNNINLQGAPNNNGPNMSHCAFNSTNSLYMQQQTTSSAVGPNNLQQFKTIDTQSLNEARINVNTSNLHSRQHYANAPTNLPMDSSKTRTSLPSDLNYCPPTENAHHGQSSLFGGYIYQLFAEKSNNANVQMLSTCAQNLQPNNAAQRAVAVVTPLSPIGTAPVNVLDKSANVKMNVSPVQETVHHQPNIPHPLVTSANLMNQTGEPNDLTSKHQRPKSAEPRLNDGLCNVIGAKSPDLANESTGPSLGASSPNLKCVVAEQNKSVPAQMQNEPAEKTYKNCTVTDKKTIDPDTVPFIEWPLDRLQTLMAVIQQMENGDQKNIHKTDPGKDILKLYWNGDTRKFSEAVESGIYQSIMEEVYIYSPMNEPVILRQIVNDARSKVIKDFHVLKHNEAPSKMMYTSSWLNLNENVDDIDKECGYPWFFKSFQNVPEHEAQNLACEAPSKLQEATEKPSLIRTKQLPSVAENKVPADEPTSTNNESLHENVPVSFNGQSPPVNNINCLPKHNCQLTELTNSQPIITNSLEAMVDLDEQGVPTGKSSLDNQFGTKSVVSPKSTSQSDYTNSPKPIHVVAEQQEIVPSSQMQVGSSQKILNDCAVLDKNVRCETTPKPSQEPPVHMNEGETDKMDASATKVNVLPHEMARQCFANEMKGHQVIAAFLDKHEVPLLNTPQVLDTQSTEEPISRQKLEEKAKYSASRVLASLSDRYKSSLAEHNKITDKVQQEQQIFSEKNMYDEIREESPVPSNAQSPPVIDNVSPKLNEQQPNTVNPLKGMRSLVRTLEKRNVSLIKYKKLIEKRGGLKKHKPSSRTSKLDNSFGNRVGAQSPMLTDESSSQSDCTIEASTLSPVVEKRQFVPLTQVQNESSEMMLNSKFDKTVRCETDPKPCQELSVQINKFVEMDASSSVKLDVLTLEVAKLYFAENKDIAATPKNAALRLDDPLCNRGKSPVLADASPPKLYPVLTGPSQMRNESDKEMPEIDCVVTDKNVRCDTDPKPGQERPVEMNEEEIGGLHTSACIKINVLPHEVAMQCFADQTMEDKDIAAPPETMHKACLLNSPTDTVSTKEQINLWRLERTVGAKNSVLTEGSVSQSNCASPPKLDPVIEEPSQGQNNSNEEMHEIDCMLTDESVRCETDPKPSQELPVNINTEKIDGLDSIKINVLPHDMAELWFAGETEDKDLQKDTTVHNSTEDQVKVQVLELKEVLLEDVKPEERKYSSSGGEQLESYCCLAKWFQTLEYGNGSLCMCQIKPELREKEIKFEAHSTSLEVQAEKDSPGECERVEMDAAALERTDDSEATDDSEDENPLLHYPTMDKTKIAKDISSSEEVSRAETETSEQKRNESPTKCATNMALMNEIEQDTPAPDLKKTNTVCLALYGSSSEKGNQLKLTKRYKEKSSCDEPPKTLQITISSHQKVKNNSESKKRKCVESEDEDATDRRERIRRASLQNLVQRKSLPSHPVSGLSKNRLSSTSVRNLLSQSANVKSDVHLAEGNKRKRQLKHTTQQMSMNKYIIRGKTVSSKLLHSPENVKKSKYELGNPVLMPLDEGPALEFKVLPETFNFEDVAELNCAQADTSQSMQNEMSGPEEKAKRMKTSHVPTRGVWSVSPLKKMCTQPIQDTDVSGSCSLFQEFKKKYQEKKDIASKQNLNSGERA